MIKIMFCFDLCQGLSPNIGTIFEAKKKAWEKR
jgi:hypothetical protein